MIEFLRHLFGFCGDAWHPNIFHLFMGIPTVSYAVFKIKNWLHYDKDRED
tara:strand:+ start:16936 stop:17085 length:150 start_codon:yes stop_codon:yes gene_type:complete